MQDALCLYRPGGVVEGCEETAAERSPGDAGGHQLGEDADVAERRHHVLLREVRGVDGEPVLAVGQRRELGAPRDLRILEQGRRRTRVEGSTAAATSTRQPLALGWAGVWSWSNGSCHPREGQEEPPNRTAVLNPGIPTPKMGSRGKTLGSRWGPRVRARTGPCRQRHGTTNKSLK